MSAASPAQHQQVSPTTSEPLDPEIAARATLSLLETRLQRLEFLLTGISDPSGRPFGPKSPSNRITDIHEEPERNSGDPHAQPGSSSEPIPLRLQKLEADLTKLKRLDGPAGNLVRSVDALHRRHPELFITNSASASTRSSIAINDKHSSSHDLPHLSTTVLAHAPLYHRTSAHLQTLQTLPIPPAAQSSNLINTGSKTQELRRRQARLEQEAQELKERSARVLEWWVKVGIVGMGEVWEDWESRVNEVERGLRKMEGSTRRRREEEEGEGGT